MNALQGIGERAGVSSNVGCGVPDIQEVKWSKI